MSFREEKRFAKTPSSLCFYESKTKLSVLERTEPLSYEGCPCC